MVHKTGKINIWNMQHHLVDFLLQCHGNEKKIAGDNVCIADISLVFPWGGSENIMIIDEIILHPTAK